MGTDTTAQGKMPKTKFQMLLVGQNLWDMAGIISPHDAFDLISGLKQALAMPVRLHTHYTSGMASMACLKAIEAGADGIDTCAAPFALRSSHPAIEPFVVTLSDTPVMTRILILRK